MIRKKDRRRAQGKRSSFTLHGQPVSTENLERSQKRFEKELIEYPQSPDISSETRYATAYLNSYDSISGE